MNYFFAALQTEGIKISKSKVIWITAADFTIAPLMAGFFMFVLRSPRAGKKLWFSRSQSTNSGRS